MDLDMVGEADVYVDSLYSVVVVGVMFEVDGEAVVDDDGVGVVEVDVETV